ncbi:MAG: DUF488 domain-containing protein [Armatimonadota bacterium]
MFKLKRAYEKPAAEDGFRVLVDRRWPCGVFKRDAAIDLWMKEIAPSLELETWFHRDPAKWEAFRHCYWEELREKPELIRFLEEKSRESMVTLVYRAKDTQHSNALVLLEFLAQGARRAEWKRAA